MRLLRVGEPGDERPAVLVDEMAVDVSQVVADYNRAFWTGGGVERLREALDDPSTDLPRIDLGKTRIGPPISPPTKVVCIGLNYADHAKESGADIPTEPIVFMKAANTVVGPNDDVLIPPGSAKTDYEVELAVVVGRTCRYLPDEAQASMAIAGYSISNDVSEREFQFDRGGQWVKGKSFETFNPLGPWLVTPDEAGDPHQLDLQLVVNGETRQSSNTSQLIFGVPHVIWYLSQFMVLEPGDLINTGTPPGVAMGMSPPRYLEPGDVMELTITGLGTQRQVCRQAITASES